MVVTKGGTIETFISAKYLDGCEGKLSICIYFSP